MENIVIPILGVIIGALITYFFNISVEKKTLKNKVFADMYERTMQSIDKASKSAKDIKLMKISSELETQYKHPVNYSDILDKIDYNVKNIFKNMQIKINDLIDLNLFFNYHHIPLDKYEDIIEDINNKSLAIADTIKKQQELYNSTVSTIGYIKIEENTWKLITQNEYELEKSINEYIERIVLFNGNIQKDYYKDLLKIK